MRKWVKDLKSHEAVFLAESLVLLIIYAFCKSKEERAIAFFICLGIALSMTFFLISTRKMKDGYADLVKMQRELIYLKDAQYKELQEAYVLSGEYNELLKEKLILGQS